MKAAKNLMTGGGTVAELLQFLWARKLWWLIPFVATLLLVGVLVLVGQATGIAPFIYTLF
jgi:Family of unknown function (DUF5989)